MNITVLGCGRWGAFHAWYAHHIGHRVTLWGRPGTAMPWKVYWPTLLNFSIRV